MADDEDEILVGLTPMTRNSILFTALHIQTELDDEENVEGRLGSTLYAPLRLSSVPPIRVKDVEPVYLGPCPAEAIAPMLAALNEMCDLSFDSVVTMRLVVGETPEGQPKSWRKKRIESLIMAAILDSSSGDPASFIDAALAESTIHGILLSSLVLLQYSSTSNGLKLGPIASNVLGLSTQLGQEFFAWDVVLATILKRSLDSGSDFAARRSTGEKLDMPPPQGIKSHPMTFLLFRALLRFFEQKYGASREISKDLNEALVYAVRILAINLWYLELSNLKPEVVGMGSPSSAGEQPHRTLAAKCNHLDVCRSIRQSLMELIGKIRSTDLPAHRSGLEECAFAIGAGLTVFFPSQDTQKEYLMYALEESFEQGHGTNIILAEVLASRFAVVPSLAKSLPLEKTIDLLLKSIYQTWNSDRPPSIVSFSREGQFNQNATSIQFVSEPVQPLSPASSTGGASILSLVSNRKRGEDEDEDEDATDEMASISGQTKARSVGSYSVASSLVAVAEETSSQNGDDMPPLVTGVTNAPAAVAPFVVTSASSSIAPRLVAQNQPASKSSLKSISVDPNPSSGQSHLAGVNSFGGLVPPPQYGWTLTRPHYLRHFQRNRLLWMLQSILMAKNQTCNSQTVSANANQGSVLVFDEPRCAETIQVMAAGRKVVQKADKKWGTAISSMAINSSRGDVFQWKVKVDKCEDGHIFFGVATRDASSSTYLGEDANGWGFIGKAHLWHNREKKGAYGDPIRTGDVVTLTLDCKRGTLSYASATKDFGIAFKGLKEFCQGEASLFPAVALFEKGDSVTLVQANMNGEDGSAALDLGVARGQFWCLNDGPIALEKTMSLLDRSLVSLTFDPSEDYIRHIETVLTKIPALISYEQISPLVFTLAAFTLWPNSSLSDKLALRLMPLVLRALTWAVTSTPANSKTTDVVGGKWWFYDSNTSKQVVDLTQSSAEDEAVFPILRGIIHSKRDGQVRVSGSLKGTRMVLVENWKNGPRYVSLRLMPDPRVALGWHQSETKGSTVRPMIAIKIASVSPAIATRDILARKVVRLLSTLLGKLSFVLANGKSSFVTQDMERAGDGELVNELRWAKDGLFTHNRLNSIVLLDQVSTDPCLEELLARHLDQCSANTGETIEANREIADLANRFVEGECAELDHHMLRYAGQAALVAKGGISVAQVRRTAIAAMLLHVGNDTAQEAIELDKRLAAQAKPAQVRAPVPQRKKKKDEEDAYRAASPVDAETRAPSYANHSSFNEENPPPSESLITAWRGATRIVAWAIRERQISNSSYEVVSEPLLEKTRLLLEGTRRSKSISTAESIDKIVTFCCDKGVNVAALKAVLTYRGWKAVLKAAAIEAVHRGIQLLGSSSSSVSNVNTFVLDGSLACLLVWLPSSQFSCKQISPLDVEPSGPSQLNDLVAASSSTAGGISSIPVVAALDLEDLGLTQSSQNLMKPLVSERADVEFDLEGTGPEVLTMLRLSVNSLFDFLGSRIVALKHDSDIAASLDVWNVPLLRQSDFDMILKTNLLKKIKQVMDNARFNGGGAHSTVRSLSGISAGNDIGLPDAIRLGVKSHQTILMSCLKLIDSLSHQVLSDFSPAPSCASRDHLASMVFEMALGELEAVLSRLRNMASSVSAVDEEDEVFCFHLLQLLFSVVVNGPTKSRAFMCSPPMSFKWIALLLGVLEVAHAFRVRHRTLRLLGRILPIVSFSSSSDTFALVVNALMVRIKLAYALGDFNGTMSVPDESIVSATVSPRASSLSSIGDGDWPVVRAHDSIATINSIAAECVSLLRRLMGGEDSTWLSIITNRLKEGLESSSPADIWTSLAVLGGFNDPVRVLGLVRLTIPSAQEFESFLANSSLAKTLSTSSSLSPQAGWRCSLGNTTGVVVAIQDTKCHVVLPSLLPLGDASSGGSSSHTGTASLQQDDTDAAETALGDERMRLSSTPPAGASTSASTGVGDRARGGVGRGRVMTAVVCDKADLVPVSDGIVPERALDALMPLILSLFDQMFLDDSSKATEEEGWKARHSLIKQSLSKLALPLVTRKDFTDNPKRLCEVIARATLPTDTLGLVDIHLVSQWFRHLVDAMATRLTVKVLPPPSDQVLLNPPASARSSSVPLVHGGAARTSSSSQQAQAVTMENPDPFRLDETPTGALQEMLSLDLGFPREMCVVALDRCGNDVEAAIHFCLEHAGDAEVLIEEFRWQRLQQQQQHHRQQSASTSTTATSSRQSVGGGAVIDADQRRRTIIVDKLKEMGFSQTWSEKALEAVRGEGFNQALTWLLANGDTLAEQDELAERLAEQASEREMAIHNSEPPSATSSEDVVDERNKERLMCTSGGQVSTNISNDLLVMIKQPTLLGGFPSVTARNLLVANGRWYYEITILTDNCMQMGWADASFSGDAFEGTGVGDDAHSWAYDGYRKLKWHQQSTSWGKQWKAGDVIGFAADLDAGELWFSLNGVWEDGMGLAFKGLKTGLTIIEGLRPAASFNRSEKMRFNFGPSFKHSTGPAAWSSNPAKAVGDAFDDVSANLRHPNRRTPGDAFCHVDDCFEESLGDALADRYFSHGQFGSSSMLARRSSSGASGGPLGTGASSRGDHSSLSAFNVKEPYPKACTISGTAANYNTAVDELNRVEKTKEGDEMIAIAIERTADICVTLNFRAVLVVVMTILSASKDYSGLIVSLMDNLAGNETAMKTLFKSCGPKLRSCDVLSAIVHADPTSWSRGALGDNISGKEDVLSLLTAFARKLIVIKPDFRKCILKSLVVDELASATTRPYSSVPWDDSDISSPLVVHALWTVSMDDSMNLHNSVTENVLWGHPSVQLASWAAYLLKTGIPSQDEELVRIWALCLRSPGTRLKIIATRELAAFLSREGFDDLVSGCVDQIIGRARIQDVAKRLLSRSGTVSLHAVPSKYALAMAELASLLY